MTFFGRWFVTPSAVRRYAIKIGIDPQTESGFREARDILIDMSQDAELAMTEPGDLEYWIAEDGPDLVTFVISTRKRPEGDKPQVINVHVLEGENGVIH